MVDTSTQKFRESFPALLALSPPLAALHNSRNLRNSVVEAETSLNLCPRCGAFLYWQGLTQNHCTTRLVRSNSKREGGRATNSKFLQYFCGNCGCLSRRVVENGNASLFPQRRRVLSKMDSRPSVSSEMETLSQPTPSSGGEDFLSSPSATTPKPSAPEPKMTGTSSRNRPKKKAGLQEMLARNREKEKQKASIQLENGPSLTAFLSGL